jgi:phosphoglycolate phosphatase
MTDRPPRHLIFDFDGTLADTLELVLEFGREHGPDLKIRPLTREEFRSRSMREALELMGVPLYRIPQLAKQLKGQIREHLKDLELFPGTSEFIRAAEDSGLELSIVSSNAEDTIRPALVRNGISAAFGCISSDSSIFGKSKVIRRFLRLHKIDPTQCVYIGDEVRDLEACQEVGLRMIAVDWGWDDRTRLEAAGASEIVSSWEEIAALLIRR